MPAKKVPPLAEKKTPPPAEAETPQYSFPFPLSWANIQAVLAWIARMPPQGASQPATSQ
jgi:hypothetical protein